MALSNFLSFSFLALYSVDILLLFYFGVHTYVMVYLYFRYKRNCEEKPDKARSAKDKNLPTVTVQLPIYNEFYVVDRLIECACSLDYPKSKLQIQVLDDSTDETKDKALLIIAKAKAKGHWIEHVSRTDRTGHKAGALANGLKLAKGEFIAIFDADFTPDRDFLLRTIGYFDSPEIGLVQTRWGHLNEDYSFLTKAQSFGIDGHFVIEQVARNGSGLWINFNGTAGIWRKDCIHSAGGWEHDTLTEDFDLSYRAELKGWKFLYLRDVVCKAEIPPTMNAYKAQQFRWCKGSIQTALKLMPRIFSAQIPTKTKVEAVTHLLNYSVHPLMVLNILFTAPLLLLQYWAGIELGDIPMRVLFGAAGFLSIGSFGPVLFYALSQKEIHTNWKDKLIYLPLLVMIGTGIAVMNTFAWLEAIFGIPSGFKRTPKLRIEKKSDQWAERNKYTVPVDYRAILEFGMGLYCLFCIYLSLVVGQPYVIGFMLLYAGGFFLVSFLSLYEPYRIASSAPQSAERIFT